MYNILFKIQSFKLKFCLFMLASKAEIFGFFKLVICYLWDRIKQLKVRRCPLLPWRQGSPRLLQRRSCDVLIEKIYYTLRDSRIQMNLTCVPWRSSTARRSVPLQLPVQSKFRRNLSPFIRLDKNVKKCYYNFTKNCESKSSCLS